MRSLVVFAIVLYQYVFSPDRGVLRVLYPFRGACMMYPSCSEYMILVIKKHGVMKGAFLGIVRIGKCHPFQKKLIDVP